MTDRRRFLLGAGMLAAGAVACVAWPSEAPGRSRQSAGLTNRDSTPTRSAAPPSTRPQSDDQRPLRPEGPGDTPALKRKPNFVVILADDLGWGEIGRYGQKKIKTPWLDQMSSEGLRFTDAYSPAPVCAPSRASLLTGLHSGHAPVRRNPPRQGDLPLGVGDRTIAGVLKDEGYRTGLFGKWGFGPNRPGQPSHPNEVGFTDFFGYLTHNAAKSYFPPLLWDNQGSVLLPGNTGDAGPIFGPDLIMDRTLKFLQEPQEKPFLLMLTLPLPHAPSVTTSLDRYETIPDWRFEDKVHAAQVTRLDTYVGLVLDELKKQGLADSTIVIFTSDNGPHEENGVIPQFFEASGPYRGIKRNLYEGGIRVPMIVWSPTLLKKTAGKRTGHQTAHYDLLATLADFAGIDKPPATDGLSLRKVFNGAGGAPKHKYLYWLRLHAGSTKSHRFEENGHGRRAAAAVRFGNWKLIGYAPDREYSKPGRKWKFELYDLKKDPGEQHDLAKDRPELVKRGKGYMIDSWRHPGRR